MEQGAGSRSTREAPTLPGTALLDAYLAKCSPRPGKDNVRKLSEAIDRLVAEKTPVDVIAEALERYRDKTKYGPSILGRLAADIVTECAEQAAGRPKGRASPNVHRPYSNPKNQSVYDEELKAP